MVAEQHVGLAQTPAYLVTVDLILHFRQEKESTEVTPLTFDPSPRLMVAGDTDTDTLWTVKKTQKPKNNKKSEHCTDVGDDQYERLMVAGLPVDVAYAVRKWLL